MANLTEGVDNETVSRGFISYDDYLAFPYLERYAEENGIILPPRGYVKPEAETAVEKRRINAAAAVSVILGWIFALWGAAGYVIKTSGAAASALSLVNGKNIVDIIMGMGETGGEDTIYAVAAICLCAAYVADAAVIIGGSVNFFRSAGTGKFMKTAAFLTFVLCLAAGVAGVADGFGVTIGTAVTVVLPLIVFFVNCIGGKGKRSSKENR
jgi:hypothetical protein